MRQNHMTIGRLARDSGVGVETIRYYQRRGLLDTPRPDGGAYRHYSTRHLERLQFIKRAQAVGFTLDEVAGLLRLDDLKDRTLARSLAIEKIADIEARITEQQPDQRIAWTSTSGPPNAGVVTFHRLAPDRCTVMLQLDWEPEGIVENIGDAIGAARLRVTGDLERFKRFLEERGHATGGWLGQIDAPQP